MNAKPSAWQPAGPEGLYLNTKSEIYYSRDRLNGTRTFGSLKTKVFTVAKHKHAKRQVDVEKDRQRGAEVSRDFGTPVAKDGFALEPGLPLVAGPQFHRKVAQGSIFHAAFADTEPDGWGRRVIQRDHAKRRQSDRKAGKAVDPSPLTAMDFLLAVDDASRVGALRFRDEAGVLCRVSGPGRRTAPPFLERGHLISASRVTIWRMAKDGALHPVEILRGT